MSLLRGLVVPILVLAVASEARDAVEEVLPKGVAKTADGAQTEELNYYSGGYSGGTYRRSHTTVTHTTAGDEVKNAFGRAVFGFVLFLLAFPVLWFNEGREAHMWVLFGKARQIMRSVSDNNVDPNNEAALVCVSSVTRTDETLQDPNFPVRVTNCTKLSRCVEMYQWEEQSQSEERDNGQGGKDTITTYSYNQGWFSYHIDSSSFNDRSYQNPPQMPYESATKCASNVSLGAFNLSARLIDKTCNSQSVGAGEMGNMNGFNKQGACFTDVPPGQPPMIGRIRATFTKVPCGDTTVLALQHNTSFAPLTYAMTVQNGKVVSPDGQLAPLLDGADKLDMELGKPPSGLLSCIGKSCGLIGKCIMSRQEVYELAEEKTSGSDLLDRAISGQQCIHKLLKLLGFIMLFAGLDCMTTFLPTIFRFIPFLGTWIQWILNGAAHVFSFFFAGFFFLVTVAIAWLRYRPVKAILLLLVAVGCIAAITYLSQKQQSS